MPDSVKTTSDFFNNEPKWQLATRMDRMGSYKFEYTYSHFAFSI